MDDSGFNFQWDYNNHDFYLSPRDIEKLLQLENERISRPFSPPQFHPPQFHPENTNSRLVIPTFFHPSEDELLHPPENDDVITSQPENLNLSPLSPLKNSLSEIIIKSSADVLSTAAFETSTIAMNDNTTNTQGGIFSQENLLNHTSTFSWNSTREWASEEIGAVFIVCLMIPFIICSNLLVIFSVIRFRRLHTPTNYFITSLAAVDIIVGLFTPLVIAVQIFQYGENEEMSDSIVCLLPNRILMMSCGVSLLNLATIAYDRHTALICPLEYVNIMTSRKVTILMICSWIYSGFIVWLPLVLGWYDSSFPSSQCSVDHLHQKAHILFIIAIFVPSCTVILICYSRIFVVARHHARSIAAVEFAVHRRLQVRFMIKDTKYAKTLALVIGGFLALWLPYLVYTFMKTISGISVNVWLETYLILLAVLNSGINPWIYAFKNNEFQAAFKRMAREHCGNVVCLGDDRRGSLVSGFSITPRLSRTDSRMAGTILEATTDYGLCDKVHQSLSFMNSIDSELSDYTGTSNSHKATKKDCIKDNNPNSKYLGPGLSTTCIIADETEDQSNVISCSLKENNITNSKKDIRTDEFNPVCLKDEISYNTFQTVVLNVRQATKDHLSQFKRIKNKGSDIIRSSSALSSIRPHVTKDNNRNKNKVSNVMRSSSALSSVRPQTIRDNFNKNKMKRIKPQGADIIRSSSALSTIRPYHLPISRRPSSSLPSSPMQTHNPFISKTPKSTENKPKPPKISRFHSFCHPISPPFQPLTPPIYPKLSSHYLQEHVLHSPTESVHTHFSNYSSPTPATTKHPPTS